MNQSNVSIFEKLEELRTTWAIIRDGIKTMLLVAVFTLLVGGGGILIYLHPAPERQILFNKISLEVALFFGPVEQGALWGKIPFPVFDVAHGNLQWWPLVQMQFSNMSNYINAKEGLKKSLFVLASPTEIR